MINRAVVLRPSCPRRLMCAVGLMVLILGAVAWVVRPDRRVAEPPAAIAIDTDDTCLATGGPGQGQVLNDAGRLVRSTDRYGRETHFAYDAAGRMVMQTDACGSVWRFEYGANNRLVATTDPTGHRREIALDPRAPGPSDSEVEDICCWGGPPRRTPPADPSTSAAIGADCLRTECRYDARGNLIAIIDGQGAVRGPYTYHASDQLARITQFEYDRLGRLTHRVDPKLPEGTTR